MAVPDLTMSKLVISHLSLHVNALGEVIDRKHLALRIFFKEQHEYELEMIRYIDPKYDQSGKD